VLSIEGLIRAKQAVNGTQDKIVIAQLIGHSAASRVKF
jgi:hypothetical protein